MSKKGKIVKPETIVELFGATEGRVCKVVGQFFSNGEGHYNLEDTKTGEQFNSPDIFWEEV